MAYLREEEQPVCRRIVAYMELKGISRYKLANKLGITTKQLGEYLRNECKLPLNFVKQVSEILGVPVDSLLHDRMPYPALENPNTECLVESVIAIARTLTPEEKIIVFHRFSEVLVGPI